MHIFSPPMLKFQFTPLREGRPRPVVQHFHHDAISIHAPPRGATRGAYPIRRLRLFQFTPLREGRPPEPLGRNATKAFQFTPLREGRHQRTGLPHFRRSISIHAPPRGATRHTHLHSCIGYISIHAPPRGATQNGNKLLHRDEFQFTPLREGRPRLNAPRIIRELISIHAPPRGATIIWIQCFLSANISIHAPPRGATTPRQLYY